MKKSIENEKKYYWMLKNSGDAIIIRQNGKFVFANNSLSEMLGYSRDELLAIDYKSVFSEKILQKIKQKIKQNENNNSKKYRYEMELFKKNGVKIYVEISEDIIDFNDEKAYFKIFAKYGFRKFCSIIYLI